MKGFCFWNLPSLEPTLWGRSCGLSPRTSLRSQPTLESVSVSLQAISSLPLSSHSSCPFPSTAFPSSTLLSFPPDLTSHDAHLMCLPPLLLQLTLSFPSLSLALFISPTYVCTQTRVSTAHVSLLLIVTCTPHLTHLQDDSTLQRNIAKPLSRKKY